MAKICVNIDDEIKEKLMEAAKVDDRNMSYVLRKILEDYFNKEEDKEM